MTALKEDASVAKVDELLPVTQADREAAAEIYALLGFGPCQHIIDGVEDDIGVVPIIARHRLASQATDAKAEDVSWFTIDSAPKNGSILELVVDYSDGGGPLQDAIIAPTIGWNTLADTGEDKWHIVGWDWCHDYICAGNGKVIGWRPSRLNASDDSLGPIVPFALTTPAKAEDIGQRIGDMIEEGGAWRACSGCQESNDGYVSTKYYPYSELFRCQPGSGCTECGGIGVLWEGPGFWDGYGDDLTGSPTPAKAEEGGAAALVEALGERPALNASDYEKRLRAAYCVQQKQVPDQSAIIWRSDLLQLFHELYRLRGIADNAR